MAEPESADLLPSITRILKRAGALERQPGVDVHEVSRLPVFQSRGWKRSIAEFLRWSGSTPDTWGSSSVFELLLCHGPAGARALLEAYRHDRIERAATFEEAQTQLEAVRAVVSMAAHWLHVISWDLQDAPRLSAEEFAARRAREAAGAASGPAGADASDPRLADLVAQFLREEADPSSKGRGFASSRNPVFPGEPSAPALWKTAPEKPKEPEKAPAPDPLRPRPRTPRP